MTIWRKGYKRPAYSGAKRCCHRRIPDTIQSITKPDICRLARRGGTKRTSNLIYEETRCLLKKFLDDVVRDTILHTTHNWRNTVTAADVTRALRARTGHSLYLC
ncbi:Histone H4-like protein [Mycena indigotica]|uniref:Histone H4 n=1 Tax=Mycena indigotica TaxID=2126181 RepID=A0A8H6VVF5_9AGAR|nr:Histone H4-like protein [Mycena indigotica]KAF7289734.1 Histone H4-like protein [Mycena indigotica]